MARDVMLARHTNSRVHVAHVSTAGSVEVIRRAKAQGIDVTAEVTPAPPAADHGPAGGLRPGLQGEPAAAPRRGRRRCCGTRWPTARSTRWPPTTRRTRATDKEHAFVDAAFGMLGLETALSVVSDVMVGSGAMSWTDVARVMSQTPARIAGLEGHGGRARRRPAGQPRPRRPCPRSWWSTAPTRPRCGATTPQARAQAHRRGRRHRAPRRTDRAGRCAGLTAGFPG